MSAEKQREADIAFLRSLAVETQVGSTMVALAMAADKLTAEPLIETVSLGNLRPKAKTKTKSKPKHDRRPEPEAEEKSDLEEEADKSFEL